MLKTVTALLPRTLAMAALCACSLAQAQNAPSRIGFVFTERLMTDSKLAKAADAKIEAEFSKRQKANRDMLARLKALSEKLDADAPNLVEPERTRRYREVADLEKDVQRTQREFNEDLLQRKSEERANIAQKAYKLIEQIAEQDHLDVVLQESAWTSPRIDITDKIIKLLDK
ncbi:OmpH family outer membrane protein [Massilia sp. R2A-15]|uniref:OmpH family outer membrane protein n=1 Tax=Massilia sp. R2A-15 TaxID=3064278 RepID=UPI002733A9E1|nr:OmpH family outer membrane protein [Massilia sp. R2A-15]WLI91450.1 OmpH family outer membrane protein [Massilia sp. R2A-15]